MVIRPGGSVCIIRTCGPSLTRSTTITIATVQTVVVILIYGVLGAPSKACIPRCLEPSKFVGNPCVRKTLTTGKLVISSCTWMGLVSCSLGENKLRTWTTTTSTLTCTGKIGSLTTTFILSGVATMSLSSVSWETFFVIGTLLKSP